MPQDDTRRHAIIVGRREREMEAQDRWLKRPEVAQRYRCSVRTVIRLDKQGGPKPVRIGPRMIRYRESEVEQYLNDLSEVDGDAKTEDC